MSDEDTSQDDDDHPFETAAGNASSSEPDRDPLADDDSDDEGDNETAGVQARSDDSDSGEEDLQKWEDRLDQREEGLDLRAEKLKDRTADLDEREQSLEIEREELEEWRADLEERQAHLDQREQDLDDREAAIRERENELAERASALEEKEQTLHTYVGDNLGDVEAKITDAVRGSISKSMQDIKPGKAEVDQQSVDETVASSIKSAMADQGNGRFGTVGNILLGLIGLVFVVGGATVLFSTQTDVIPRAFSDAGLNYGAAAVLVFIGLAVNLSAAADRI